MTPDKFKSIVSGVVKPKEPHLSSFGQSDLNAVARDFTGGKIEIEQAIERLKGIYSENREINQKDFDAIEKYLKRG